jgi:tRNA (mo5U34)-methyltransferase
MAFKKLNLGAFGIALTANEYEAGLHFSMGGSFWRSFARGIKEKRGSPRAEAAVTQDLAAPAQPTPQANLTAEQAALAARADRIGWYHTIDLGDGVKSKGRFDHAPILAEYKLPESFAGMRVLDVATFDGYWAFEFEKRGAKEVYALDLEGPGDLDWPPKARAAITPEQLAMRFGEGFALAKERRGSKVQRVVCNIYELTPERFGTFDVVHSGDVLLHLNSPVKALQNMARVCTNYALISDVYFPELDQMGQRKLLEYMGGRDNPTWWRISLSALEEMILDAGFSRVERLNTFSYGYRATPGKWQHAVFKAYK